MPTYTQTATCLEVWGTGGDPGVLLYFFKAFNGLSCVFPACCDPAPSPPLLDFAGAPEPFVLICNLGCISAFPTTNLDVHSLRCAVSVAACAFLSSVQCFIVFVPSPTPGLCGFYRPLQPPLQEDFKREGSLSLSCLKSCQHLSLG